MKLIVIDDTAHDAGGAGKTLTALLENVDCEKIFVRTENLNFNFINANHDVDKFFIGNTSSIVNKEVLSALNYVCNSKDFVKIEFDYGFCKYRCEQAFKKFTGLQEWAPFSDAGAPHLEYLYRNYCFLAKKHFFMSNAQMEKFKKFLPISGSAEVLSSCFKDSDIETILKFAKMRKSRPESDKYCIIDGNGGWHSEAKGIFESIRYCKDRGIKFDIISGGYESLLETMSLYKGLVFLPIIDDTCPRVTIEAVLLGLDLIDNENCQHRDEPWFRERYAGVILRHLKNKHEYFKTTMESFLED